MIKPTGKPADQAPNKASDKSLQIVRGACGHDCPDTCAWVVSVRDGKAETLEGNPDHAFTRGTLCAKVNHYLERVYYPDRVLYPLKRVGAKGEGQFVRTTWNEALAEIATRWRTIINQSGPEAILPYSSSGNQGLIQMAGLDRRLFGLLGFSKLERSICGEVAGTGVTSTQGVGYGADPEDLIHSKLIVLWGTNTIVTNLHLWPIILQARARGAKIVVIDPIRTRTAYATTSPSMLRLRCHAAVDDRSPESVLGLIALVIGLAERVEMLVQQLPQVGGLRIAWLVEGQRVAARGNHGWPSR